MAGGDKVFPTQYVALFKKNASGMKIESFMGLDCYETKNSSPSSANQSKKDTCYIWMELTIGPIKYQVTPKKEFKANLKTAVKALNWFRIRILDGMTNFG